MSGFRLVYGTPLTLVDLKWRVVTVGLFIVLILGFIKDESSFGCSVITALQP